MSNGSSIVMRTSDGNAQLKAELSRRDRGLILALVVVLFVVVTRPWLAELSFGRAETYQHASEFGRAEVHYRRALLLDRGSLDANLGLGILLANTRQFEEAIPYLERVIATEARQPDALYYLGFSLLQSGDLAAAIPILERADDVNDQPFVDRALERARRQAGGDGS